MVKNPIKRFAVMALVLLAILIVFLFYYIKLSLLYSYLVAISIVTFIFYGYDKRQSIKGKIRVPELLLHSLALIGGTVGALAGQVVFRHKTVKRKFRLIFFAIILLQIVAVGCYWYYRKS